MFVILVSLLVLQCAFALPTADKEQSEYREWAPNRVAYARDFDRWFEWVPWGSNEERRKTPSVKERIQVLESRQNALFDLVRCESYGQTDCSQFRSQAETIFEAPSKDDGPTPPTKIVPDVTTPASQNAENTTAGSTTPRSATPAVSSTSTEGTTAPSTTASTPATSSEEATAAPAQP